MWNTLNDHTSSHLGFDLIASEQDNKDARDLQYTQFLLVLFNSE